MFAITESSQIATLCIRRDIAMVIMHGLEALKVVLTIRSRASNVVLTCRVKRNEQINRCSFFIISVIFSKKNNSEVKQNSSKV